jgi:hypothetical protein
MRDPTDGVIGNEGMPDTTKHRQHRQRESGRSRMPDPAALVKLLGEWMDGDETEQRETFSLLRRSLDEQRPDGYKLFQ